MNTKELEDAVIRLTCQSAALISVLQTTPAADGEPILNPARWKLFEDRMRHELQEKGLQPGI